MKRSTIVLLVVCVVLLLGWVWLPAQREFGVIRDDTVNQVSVEMNDSNFSVDDNSEILIEQIDEPLVSNSSTISDSVLLTPQQLFLTSGSWQLDRLVTSDGSVLLPSDPNEFVMRFSDTGQVVGKTDCNTFSGRYEFLPDATLALGPFAMTMIYCEDSIESHFLEALQSVYAHNISNTDVLELETRASTTVYFSKVQIETEVADEGLVATSSDVVAE